MSFCSIFFSISRLRTFFSYWRTKEITLMCWESSPIGICFYSHERWTGTTYSRSPYRYWFPTRETIKKKKRRISDNECFDETSRLVTVSIILQTLTIHVYVHTPSLFMFLSCNNHSTRVFHIALLDVRTYAHNDSLNVIILSWTLFFFI